MTPDQKDLSVHPSGGNRGPVLRDKYGDIRFLAPLRVSLKGCPLERPRDGWQ